MSRVQIPSLTPSLFEKYFIYWLVLQAYQIGGVHQSPFLPVYLSQFCPTFTGHKNTRFPISLSVERDKKPTAKKNPHGGLNYAEIVSAVLFVLLGECLDSSVEILRSEHHQLWAELAVFHRAPMHPPVDSSRPHAAVRGCLLASCQPAIARTGCRYCCAGTRRFVRSSAPEQSGAINLIISHFSVPSLCMITPRKQLIAVRCAHPRCP